MDISKSEEKDVRDCNNTTINNGTLKNKEPETSIENPVSIKKEFETEYNEIKLNATLSNTPVVKIEQVFKENGVHSDHTYDTGSFRETVLNVPPNEFKISNKSCCSSSKIGEQIYSQICNAIIKAEVDDVHTDEEPSVKTETVNSVYRNNYNHNSRHLHARTYKCNKCNLNFSNEQVLKDHFRNCSSRTLPFIKTIGNTAGGKMFKRNQRECSSHTLKKLIENVRNHLCLYDTENEGYKNIHLKNAIWSNIASECNLTSGSVARTEWKKMKNQFITAITQQNSYNNLTKNQIKSWKYQQQMEFILPFLNNRESNTTVQVEHSGPIENIAPVVETRVSNEVDIDEEMESNYSVTILPPTKKSKLSTSQRIREEQSRQPAVWPSSSAQPLDMFFLSMCETTKNLPSYVQLQVKKKIFQAVIEAEEIVAAMHNDQEKNNMFPASSSHNEFPNNTSPFSVHSTLAEDAISWQDD